MKKEDFEFARKLKDAIHEIDEMIELLKSKRCNSIAVEASYRAISGTYYEKTTDYKVKEGLLKVLEDRKKELEQEFESI